VKAGLASASAAALLAGCTGTLEPSDLIGQWGGTHVEVVFDSTGAGTVEYDCAHGRIAPPITLDGGALRAAGTHTPEHGGPVREDEVLESRPATYAGTVSGDLLTFTVTLTDSGTVLGPFAVRRGAPAQLFKCL
jgi:hypothetical protein